METLGDLSPDAESERAVKFYEQALLLVDCCRIPEAIRLLEQAIKIEPDSEIYKESLAILQMNYFPAEQQDVSYASVVRPKANQDNGKENLSSYKWKMQKTKVRENLNKAGSPSTLSLGCHDDTHGQSSIENPWASFMKRTPRRKKAQASPIDGISEIEIPPVNDNFHTGSPICCKGCDQDYQDKGNTPVLSDSAQKEVRRPVIDAREDCIHGSAYYISEKENFPENKIANGNGNLDVKFMEEFCLARESATDDWDKYYEVLCSGMEETCSESDVLFQNTNKSHECSDTLDEIKVTENVKCTKYTGKDHLTQRPDSSSSIVCPKCGHPKGSGNPTSPTKNRIHFVNGVCLSSPSGLTCTCNKQEKFVSESQSAKTPLSSSQQEFYRNLRQYFGRSKVNSVKTEKKAENDLKSSESHQKSSSACTFDTYVSSATFKNDKPLNAEPKVNVSETTQNSESKSERRNSKEHVGHKATDNSYTGSECRRSKPSFDSSQVKADKKSSGKEKVQPVDKQKSRRHNKVQSKTKEPIKTGHVKNKREDVSHNDGLQGEQPRVKDCNKSKGSHKKGADDTSRPAAASETKDTCKLSQRQKEEHTSNAESDCTALVVAVYDTGIRVASACLQVSKSITYYIVLLAALLFTFLLYCFWLATSWLVRKVLHFFAVERLFSAVKGRISSLFEWLRKSRGTPQKTAQKGQTYDLPKNGDSAIRHMLENRDSDPYSVLGVPSDASDDDIRRQYRKLAVLIHPDKNMDSQADEAFKILANAFDVLSDPDKRRDYDREMAWKRRQEEREERFGRPNSPEQFFADLGRKMQEMQNYLHCNQCDGKHRRYSTDRFVLTARYCSRCNTRHAAKEGDLWAESSFLGYKIHFYACMEGEIFDVTEWAACQGIGNYRVEANPHTVHLKLKTRQPYASGFNSRSEEEDFENFMRAFFGQFNPPREERHHGSNKQPKKRKRKKR